MTQKPMETEPGPESGVDGPVVGSYPTYAQAQRAVDFLSDNKFPVQHVAIIGTDLRMVENVIGRLTIGRVVLAGVSSGAWFGLLVGVLLSLFGGGESNVLGNILGAVVIGALFGVVFGVVSYRATGGKRDFTSRSRVVAGHYDVTCAPAQAEDAKNLLIKLGWRVD